MTENDATEEIAAVGRFLADHRDVTLFCRDGQGSPLGYPMRSTSVGEGAVYFTTYRKSTKVAHLERDPRVRLLCYVVSEDGTVEWVDAGGSAVMWVPTAEEIDRLIGGPRDTRVPAGMLDHVRSRLLDGRRIMIKVPLEQSRLHRGAVPVG